jgi:hypothetical protein
VTTETSEQCVTNARLVVDKATASPAVYTLGETACSVLRLTGTGDIVLYDSPTGHDWSTEALRVDTEAELIELGPWTAEAGITYRFVLSAPECQDGCDCPALRRRADGEDLILPLGQRCD